MRLQYGGINIIELQKSTKGDQFIRYLMSIHYSKPKGFVGRQIVYKVVSEGVEIGAIVGGSATLHLPGRNEFFGTKYYINSIVNNTFFHLENQEDKNMGTKVLKMWRKQISDDWEKQYGDKVVGFETLVEVPRTGAVYKADNWIYTGITKGFTCKRVGGEQQENWSGVRVWNKNPETLRPKLVFCKMR